MLELVPLLVSVAAQPRPAITIHPAARPVTSACAALTRADVESEIGRRIGNGVESDGGTTCDYVGTNGVVSIRMQALTTDLNMNAELAALRAALPSARMTPVPGLGIRAVRLELPNAGVQLHVIAQDRKYIMVSVLGFGEASRVHAAAESLARRLLDVI